MKMLSLSLFLAIPLCAMNKSHEIALKHYNNLVVSKEMSDTMGDSIKKDLLIKKFQDVVIQKGSIKGGGPIGATVGAIGGATLVQVTYNGFLGGLGLVLTPFITPIGAAAVVGTVRFYTAPAAVYATKVVAISGAVALGAASGPL